MNFRTLSMAFVATAFVAGGALAQNAGAGDTSGTAAGGNANPSTAVQKQGRSDSSTGDDMKSSGQGGAPGVEGAAGSKSGATQKSRTASSKFGEFGNASRVRSSEHVTLLSPHCACGVMFRTNPY